MRYLKSYKLFESVIPVEEDRVQIRLGRNMYNHFGKVQNIIIMVDDQDITSEDGVVGLGQMNIVINDGEIYVGNIVIPEKYRGQGIATIVYQKISDHFGLPIVNSITKGRNQLDQGGQIWKNREKFEPRNIQESIRNITKSEFPTELDIQEIFYDLTDEEPLSECKLYESGYQYFTCENLRRRTIRSQLFYDMSFEENWINKECKDINDTWKNIFIDLSKPLSDDLIKISSKYYDDVYFSEVEEPGNYNIERGFRIDPNGVGIVIADRNYLKKLQENILNNIIPAYPIIYLNLGLFHEDKLPVVIECLQRLYEVTGFRPTSSVWTEDYVDENTGDVVSLLGADLQLYKVSDEEYQNLCKINQKNRMTMVNSQVTKHFL